MSINYLGFLFGSSRPYKNIKPLYQIQVRKSNLGLFKITSVQVSGHDGPNSNPTQNQGSSIEFEGIGGLFVQFFQEKEWWGCIWWFCWVDSISSCISLMESCDFEILQFKWDKFLHRKRVGREEVFLMICIHWGSVVWKGLCPLCSGVLFVRS